MQRRLGEGAHGALATDPEYRRLLLFADIQERPSSVAKIPATRVFLLRDNGMSVQVISKVPSDKAVSTYLADRESKEEQEEPVLGEARIPKSWCDEAGLGQKPGDNPDDYHLNLYVIDMAKAKAYVQARRDPRDKRIPSNEKTLKKRLGELLFDRCKNENRVELYKKE